MLWGWNDVGADRRKIPEVKVLRSPSRSLQGIRAVVAHLPETILQDDPFTAVHTQQVRPQSVAVSTRTYQVARCHTTFTHFTYPKIHRY